MLQQQRQQDSMSEIRCELSENAGSGEVGNWDVCEWLEGCKGWGGGGGGDAKEWKIIMMGECDSDMRSFSSSDRWCKWLLYVAGDNSGDDDDDDDATINGIMRAMGSRVRATSFRPPCWIIARALECTKHANHDVHLSAKNMNIYDQNNVIQTQQNNNRHHHHIATWTKQQWSVEPCRTSTSMCRAVA